MQLVAGIAADGQLFVRGGGRACCPTCFDRCGCSVCGRAQFAAANRSELAAEISRGGTVPGGPGDPQASVDDGTYAYSAALAEHGME